MHSPRAGLTIDDAAPARPITGDPSDGPPPTGRPMVQLDQSGCNRHSGRMKAGIAGHSWTLAELLENAGL
jgi:hypothetical protein